MLWPREGSIAKQKATYSTVQQGFSHISETTQGPLTDSLNQHFHWLWRNKKSQIKDGRTWCHLSFHSSFHVNDPEVTNYCSALIQNQLLLTRWQHSSTLIEWCGAFNLWPKSLDILHGCNAFTRQSHVHVCTSTSCRTNGTLLLLQLNTPAFIIPPTLSPMNTAPGPMTPEICLVRTCTTVFHCVLIKSEITFSCVTFRRSCYCTANVLEGAVGDGLVSLLSSYIFCLHVLSTKQRCSFRKRVIPTSLM